MAFLPTYVHLGLPIDKTRLLICLTPYVYLRLRFCGCGSILVFSARLSSPFHRGCSPEISLGDSSRWAMTLFSPLIWESGGFCAQRMGMGWFPDDDEVSWGYSVTLRSG